MQCAAHLRMGETPVRCGRYSIIIPETDCGGSLLACIQCALCMVGLAVLSVYHVTGTKEGRTASGVSSFFDGKSQGRGSMQRGKGSGSAAASLSLPEGGGGAELTTQAASELAFRSTPPVTGMVPVRTGLAWATLGQPLTDPSITFRPLQKGCLLQRLSGISSMTRQRGSKKLTTVPSRLNSISAVSV